MSRRPHPLSPLSVSEANEAVALVRAIDGISLRVRFVSVEMREPAKADYLAWRDTAGPSPAREAFIVGLDPDAGRGFEAIVSLDERVVVSHTVLPGDVQPAVHVEEFIRAGEAVLRDPGYIAALAARGITDLARVHVESWAAGSFEPRGGRYARAIAWITEDAEADNQYARPLYGLVAAVDLHAMQVVRIDDHAPGTPPPTKSWPYHDAGGEPYRDDIKPIVITQPDGPSFTLDDDRVLRWQNWELIVGFHPREGLVLHDIAYRDHGERRQICHRASIAELVIPYGDPNPTVNFKNVFDTGEYGMGPLINSLALGCDCLGEIRYLDVTYNAHDGEAKVIPQGICIHEEDDNMLWKHTHWTGPVARARARRLVISTFATVGNYEYGYFWYFHQDGSWQFEAKLTGIVHTAGVPVGVTPAARSPHSLPLGDGFVTSAHQHFFCARLDLDIDGTDNVAAQVEFIGDPWGPENPAGAAFREVVSVFERESQAQVDVCGDSARRFRVANSTRTNRIGDRVAYELMPGENAKPLAQPDAPLRQRARMLDHQLWVTPYRRDERYPAGEYPYQSAPGEGLSAWTAADRELADTDVVLWYVFGAHHFPRLEDWPVMPVVNIGFHLRPVGFFNQNPALDVPPPPSACHA
jgi:primary-amine oxidase